jgi:hypothetical protein
MLPGAAVGKGKIRKGKKNDAHLLIRDSQSSFFVHTKKVTS